MNENIDTQMYGNQSLGASGVQGESHFQQPTVSHAGQQPVANDDVSQQYSGKISLSLSVTLVLMVNHVRPIVLKSFSAFFF